MRTIGKTVTALCMAAMMLLTAAACNQQADDGNLKVEGTWKRALNEDDYHGGGADFYRSYLDNLTVQDTTLTFGAENKLTISAKVSGEDKSEEVSYTVTPDTVTFNDEEGYVTGTAGSFTLKMKNQKLVVDTDNLDYICFIKQ